MALESNINSALLELGFSENTYAETVALFLWNSNKHVMALGLRFRNGFLYSRVFKGSKMYEVLRSSEKAENIQCIVCISSNPVLFYNAVLNKSEVLKCFENLECFKSFCDASIETVVANSIVSDEFVEVFLKPIKIGIYRRIPRVFTRASAAIIEALVWYTKMVFADESRRREYLNRILMLRDVVYRSSLNKVYREIIDDVVVHAQSYVS
ncbi:DUF447 family protein [Ignisphaera sp. 4213-co]|uniref:DUF447 family protein n=1 Tax=Ignisphaera cupida TaxID=3050454 RepID=A0ABD4Z7J1_9CREN|nr:DUF447 domain-containing protein [Ignisphaera sp. 4213-co]MDK6029204.1 DUF447 family protein [Ignisphaera sp. 4213-co]